jgi:hypothetical protein
MGPTQMQPQPQLKVELLGFLKQHFAFNAACGHPTSTAFLSLLLLWRGPQTSSLMIVIV